jgi:hypothetical protein
MPFEEINEGGVSDDRDSQDWFVGCGASLVALCFSDEQPNLPGWAVDS